MFECYTIRNFATRIEYVKHRAIRNGSPSTLNSNFKQIICEWFILKCKKGTKQNESIKDNTIISPQIWNIEGKNRMKFRESESYAVQAKKKKPEKNTRFFPSNNKL